MAQTYRFDATKIKLKGPGVPKVSAAEPLRDFHMREVNGVDEELAANTAKAKGGSATNMEELTRLSIVAVNGKPVAQPYLQFDGWNSKARALALRAFAEINSINNDEADSFAGTAEAADLPSSGVGEQSVTG